MVNDSHIFMQQARREDADQEMEASDQETEAAVQEPHSFLKVFREKMPSCSLLKVNV